MAQSVRCHEIPNTVRHSQGFPWRTNHQHSKNSKDSDKAQNRQSLLRQSPGVAREDVLGVQRSTKIKTTSSTPASVTVTAVPAGVNSIKVAWSQPKRAESIQILVSHHNKALDSAKTRFVVKVPVHARSTTITIPSSWRAKIGDGSGNPVFVRVLLKNAGKSKKTKIAWSYTQARTPSGTSAQKLRFATYNAGSVNATKTSQDAPGHTVNRPSSTQSTAPKQMSSHSRKSPLHGLTGIAATANTKHLRKPLPPRIRPFLLTNK